LHLPSAIAYDNVSTTTTPQLPHNYTTTTQLPNNNNIISPLSSPRTFTGPTIFMAYMAPTWVARNFCLRFFFSRFAPYTRLVVSNEATYLTTLLPASQRRSFLLVETVCHGVLVYMGLLSRGMSTLVFITYGLSARYGWNKSCDLEKMEVRETLVCSKMYIVLDVSYLLLCAWDTATMTIVFFYLNLDSNLVCALTEQHETKDWLDGSQ
jgi:hypothetical protein